MRATLIPLALLASAFASPGAAAQEAAESDPPERILATDLPMRDEVWARMDAAVDRQVERAFSTEDPVWTEIRERAYLAWDLNSFGHRREAAEIALDLLQQMRSRLGDEYAVTDSRAVIELLVETGEVAEANELASALIEESRRQRELAADEEAAFDIEWRLVRSLEALPNVQRSLIEGMLNRLGLSAEHYVTLLEELVQLEIHAGRLQRALHIQSRLLEVEQNSWNYFEAAALLAAAQPGAGEAEAIRWAESALETQSELSEWFIRVARILNSRGDTQRAAQFAELALRATLSDPDVQYAGNIASPAFELAQAGRCDLAFPGAELASLLLAIKYTRDAIEGLRPANPEDRIIVHTHQPAFAWQAPGLVVRTRLTCGQRQSAFDLLFAEDSDGSLRHSAWDIRSLIDGADTNDLGRGIFRAYGETIARRHFSGRSPLDEEYIAVDELAFASLALRQAGYFQLADDFLLAAWNASFEDDVWPSDLAAIYAALPED